MDPVVKKAWVEALRSGHYKQGRGKLRSLNNEFCCLGVLCDLGKNRDTEWHKTDDGCYAYGPESYRIGTLPEVVLEASGLWRDDDPQARLIRMNDGLEEHRRHSFDEIADWIDVNL